MSNETQHGYTTTQKVGILILPLVFSTLVLFVGPLVAGSAGTVVTAVLTAVLGIVTWFISAGWNYKVEVTAAEIRIRDARRSTVIPLDKVGLLVRNGGFPFPTLWLVLKNCETGTSVPEKGVDPQARQLIEGYQRRNPGKNLSVVTVPGGYLRSVIGFAAEVKRRIPPVTIDERLSRK